MAWILLSAGNPAALGGSNPTILRTWEDLEVGAVVSLDKPSGARFLEGASAAESASAGACSGTHFLIKPGALADKAGVPVSDPSPWTLVFDTPQSFVGMCVGNPEGKAARFIRLSGYAALDATKPVVTSSLVLPPGTPISQPLSICRLLEHDLVRVELSYGEDGWEMLDDLKVAAVSGSTTRIHFEEQPPGTLIESQYAGVRFLTRPEIVTRDALGVDTRSQPQALRQRIAGETDAGPMILDFEPNQGAVRVHTGYPSGEKQTGALRVRLLAYAGGAKGLTLVASDEVSLTSSQALSRSLEVCRMENDIARIELWFDSPFGGHEVMDDLEFGPVAVEARMDREAPSLWLDSPVENTVFEQPSSRPEHRQATVRLRGRIREDWALSSFRVQVLDTSGAVRFDDGERLGIVRGTAPDFVFETPVVLEYGVSVVRLTVVDGVGRSSVLERQLAYMGPPPVEVTRSSPEVVYPAMVFREASASGPAISNAAPVVRMVGYHLNPETRFFLVPESRAFLPPSAPDLIEVAASWRSLERDAVDLPIPDAVMSRPGRYVWLVWDLWSRPGMTPWTRGGALEVRAWPFAALWSIGFRNRDETNDWGDFEGVYGEDVLPGFLEPTTPVDECSRGVNAIQFFLGRYLPSLNAQNARGSCFGFAAASQFFASGAWRASGFDPAVRLPSGFLAPETMRFARAGCAPQTPANLWAWIQTLFGIHTSSEFLESWSDQTETVSSGAMVGDPLRTAARIRETPGDYILGFTPFTSNVGHAVAPYRVENRDPDTVRIWVLDSNFPYDPAQPEDALVNRMAVNRFIEIDRRSNSFRFSIGATADPSLEYQTTNRMMGSALVATPMSLFSNPRSIPMSDYLAEQYFGITGDVEAEFEVDGAGRWGWDDQGEFRGDLSGLRVVPSFDGGDPSVANPVVLVPSHHSRVAVTVRGKDPAHHVMTGNGGVILGARRSDRDASQKDRYEAGIENNRPKSLRFTAGSSARNWQPEIGEIRSKDGEIHFRFFGFELAAGQSLRWEALPEQRGARVYNETEKPLRCGVEVTSGGTPSGQDRRWFGPFEIPSGSVMDWIPHRWPAVDSFLVKRDANADGISDEEKVVSGQLIPRKQGDVGDCNRNGLLDAFDIAVGTSVDAQGDGTPDECSPVNPGGNGGQGGGSVECPPKGEHRVSFAGLADGPVPGDVLGIVRLNSAAEIREGQLTSLPGTDGGIGGIGPLDVRFLCPRGQVTLEMVNPSKNASVRVRAWAYSRADGTKPVAMVEDTIPAGMGSVVPLTLCRPLEEDIIQVVVECEGDAVEVVRAITHGTRSQTEVRRYDFEDRPVGTVIYGQYPGVLFVDRPVIIAPWASEAGALGRGQRLRKPSTDLDLGPMTLRLDPPQSEVRVRVSYPDWENDGRPLRVRFRAFGAGKGNTEPVASDEAVLASPQSGDRILKVVRCAADIREVQVEYLDRPSSGMEAIDDLEFGPVPVVPGGADVTAPVLRLVSPESGTLIPQTHPLNSTGGASLVVDITEDRAIERVQITVRDGEGAEFRRLDDTSIRVTGTAPRFRLEATLPLAYGRNTVEVQVVDTAGHVGMLSGESLVLNYRGPAPVGLTSSTPEVAYPEDRIRSADRIRPEQYPEVRLPRTVVTLRGTHFNPYVRVFLVRPELAQLPPRSDALIAAEVVSRNEEGTEIQVRLPAALWTGLDASSDLELRWVVEDGWERPDRVRWSLGGRIVARQRPWPMTYGFGLVNVEGPNTLTDFDGVFRHNAYLSWTDRCWRDPIYLGFYEWGYSVTLNASPGGSCFGMVAASQALYLNEFNSDWLNAGFVDVAFLPAGRMLPGSIRESIPTCGPRSPGSLWSWIQTYHGMQQSEEHLYQQLNQIVRRRGVWRGNIAARLAQLGTRPYAYLLCIKPMDGTTGHCVLPYRVEPLETGITRVWVYDPNYPYNHYLPETHPRNIRSVYSYVDMDPVANRYEFDVDANYDTNDVAVVRSHFHAGRRWSGEGLTVTLLPSGNRTMPGLGYGIDYIFSTVSGEARAQYSNAKGQRWGWSPDGTLVEEMDEVHPFTPFTFAGDETDQVTLLTRRSNAWSEVTLQAKGSRYHFVTGSGGMLFGIRNTGAVPGGVDHAEQRLVDGVPRALRFESGISNDLVEPFLVLPDGPGREAHPVSWRWRHLRLPAGSPVVFEGDPNTGAIGVRNEGRNTLQLELVRERAGAGGPEVVEYGNVVVPSGGAVRLTPVGPSESPRLLEELDRAGNGTYESVGDHVPGVSGPPPRLLPVGLDKARKRLRLRIQGAPRERVVVERSSDLLRWETAPTEPVANDATDFESPLDAETAFFRVRRIP